MQNISAIVEETLARAKQGGASFCEVLASRGESSLKRMADGEVYQAPASEGVSFSFSCIINGRRVNGAFDSLAGLESEVLGAFTKVHYLPSDTELFTPAGPYPSASVPQELLYDVETAKLDDERLIDVIQRVNAIVGAEGFVFDGAVSHGRSELLFANSAGTFQRCLSTSAQLQIFGFDPKDRSISAYQTVAGKALSQFPVEELARDVARKLAIQRAYLTKHGGKRINPFGGKEGPQRLSVIMEPSCWAGLLAIFSGQAEAWNGKAFQEGTSFFSGKLGTRVMGENITISDDPLHPEGIPQPFDYEGFPKERLILVEKGVARNVTYDNALAAKYKTVSTGHGLPAAWRHAGAMPMHLVVEGGASSVEDMIRDSKEPTLWITTLHYIRATHNQDGKETGTTLHGVFLVENGEVVGPTEHLRFDESVPEVLNRITHIGKSLPSLSMEADETPYIVPPMRAEGFRFVSIADRSTT